MKFTITSKKFGNKIVLIDDEDWNLIKDFTWYPWSTKRHNSIYVRAAVPGIRGKEVRLHRLIMNAKPGQLIDHKNGNALDNRKENLRITNSLGNNMNSTKRKSSTSKFKGVHWGTREQKWKCQIQYNKKKIALGTYNSEIEAAKAYNKAALLYHGEYARLNDIGEFYNG